MENNFWAIIFFVNVKMRAKSLSLTWKKWTRLSHRDIVKKGDFMCKLKLKGGYFCMSLPEDSRKYVGFYRQGNLYHFFCLWIGLAPAPYIFTKLLKVQVQVAFLHWVGTLIIIYLEDMLILSKSSWYIKQAISSKGNSSLQGYNNPSNAGVGFCDTWYESLTYLWNCMNQNISSELRNYSKVIPKAYLCYMGIVFDVLISFKLQWFVFSICDPDSNLCNSLFIHKLLISCTDFIKAIGYLSVFAFLLY